MNLLMKSAKHVNMNRASFGSQHFYIEGLQQIGEKSEFCGEKCTLYHVKVVYCHIF